MKRPDRPEYRDHQSFKLSAGDKAFYLPSYDSWQAPEVIAIKGDCDEGHGYSAHSPNFETEYPDSEGDIHTCSGFLTPNRKVARAESLSIARDVRKKLASSVATYTRHIQYLDYVIANKGKA